MALTEAEELEMLELEEEDANAAPNIAQQTMGFIDNRFQKAKEAYQLGKSGQQSAPSSIFQMAMQSTAGPVSDVVNKIIEPPEGYTQAVQRTMQPFTQSSMGQSVESGINKAGKFISGQYSKLSPETQRNIESTGIGLNALPGPFLGKAAAETAAMTGTATKGIAAAAIAPKITKTTGRLARRMQDLGVDLRSDQISPTRARKTVQKISQDIPFSGVDAAEDLQKTQWNKAVAKTIGQDAENLGPETILKFSDDSARKFNSAIGSGDFKITPNDVSAIKTLEDGLSKNVTEDIEKIVKSHINQFKNDLTEKTIQKSVKSGTDPFSGKDIFTTENIPDLSTINAQKLASLRSDLIQSLPKIDAKARPHVADIVDIIDDIAERNISKEAAGALKQVRKEWRNFKTIEPLLEKSTDGFINPTDLMQRVASNKHIKAVKSKIGDDDLIDLARGGKKFLVKAGGSDTFAKTAIGGAGAGSLATALGVGGPMAALAALGIQGGIVGLNRILQAVNKSKTVVNKSINKSLK